MKILSILLFFITIVFADAKYESPNFINLLDRNVNEKTVYKDTEKRTFEIYDANKQISCNDLIVNNDLVENYKQVGSPTFVVLYNRLLDDNIYEPKVKSSIVDQYGVQRDFIKKIFLPLNKPEYSLSKKEIWELKTCMTNYFNKNSIRQVDRSFLLRAGQIGSNESDTAREVEIKSLSKGADYLIEVLYAFDKNYKIKIIKLENGQIIFNEDNISNTKKTFKKSKNNDFANVTSDNMIANKFSSSFEKISNSLVNHWKTNDIQSIDAQERISRQNKALGINNGSTNSKEEANKGTKSTGTAFFITKNGYLITNNHVIDNSNSISVDYKDNTYDAKLIDTDKHNDIALIKIDVDSTPAINLNSIDAKKGTDICALGYPLINMQGKELKATFGHINSLSGFKGDPRFMQIDSPIQPGNSGGPLVNSKGSVVGIVTAKLNQVATYKATGSFSQNVNYALKISYALPLIKKNNIKLSTSVSKELSNSKLVDSISKSVVLVKTN